MNEILKRIRAMGADAKIIGIHYEGSDHPDKNVRINDERLTEVPFGEAVGPAEFTHNGNTYLRVIDHNDHEKIKVLRVDKIKSVTHNGLTTYA